jgi:hypothetical protein
MHTKKGEHRIQGLDHYPNLHLSLHPVITAEGQQTVLGAFGLSSGEAGWLPGVTAR